jgi:hypothetical protein
MSRRRAALSSVQFADRVLHRPHTRGQRAFASVAFDGADPIDLPDGDREIAIEMFGGVERIPPEARRVVVGLFGRDSGKTSMTAEWAVHRLLVADAKVGPGEVPTGIVVAPDLKTARLTVRMAIAHVRATPRAGTLVAESKDGFTLRRADGAEVTLEAFAASRGGYTTRGRPILFAVLDESAFHFSGDGYSRTDDDIFKAILPRLMKGGIVVLITTPWGEDSLVHRLFAANFGNPTTALVAKASTLVMRDNAPDVVELVNAELARDEQNAKREFFCEFLAGGSSAFFDAAQIERVTQKERPEVLTLDRGAHAFGAIDTGFRKDSSTIAIVHVLADGTMVVAELAEMRPSAGAPLTPMGVAQMFADVARRHGVSVLMSDGFYVESIKENLVPAKIQIVDAPPNQSGKVKVYMAARAALNEARLLLPPHPRLLGQLRSITSRPTSGGGLEINAPRRGGHGDLASALVLAVYAASKHPKGPHPRPRCPTLVIPFDGRGGIESFGDPGPYAPPRPRRGDGFTDPRQPGDIEIEPGMPLYGLPQGYNGGHSDF